MSRMFLPVVLAVAALMVVSSCKSSGSSGLASVELVPNRHAPGPSSMHSAHWTGSQMLIWGGIIGYEDRGIRRRSQNLGHRGWVFEPGSSLWRPMPRSQMIQRYNHASVYSNGVLVLWGGSEGGRLRNTGEVFDLASQHWVSMSQQGALSSRMGHSAVALGEVVIFFGGENETTTLGDAAIFSPDDNRWEPLLVPDWVTPRAYHGALAVGDKMVIWGGVSAEGNVIADGVIFDPASGEWRAMSASGAPLGRYGHTFISTGEQLVVWGGRREVNGRMGYMRDGGVYDIASDSWRPIPAASAPPARELHSSVWTGREVVILGGTAGSRVFRGGAAYDPKKKRWRAVNVPDELPPRYQHSAVWTGDKILVWGGISAPHQMVNGNETGIMVVP